MLSVDAVNQQPFSPPIQSSARDYLGAKHCIDAPAFFAVTPLSSLRLNKFQLAGITLCLFGAANVQVAPLHCPDYSTVRIPADKSICRQSRTLLLDLIAMLQQPPSVGTADVAKSKAIADGDLVIVYERIDAMKSYFVDAQKTYHGRFGLFPVQVRCLLVLLTLSCFSYSLASTILGDWHASTSSHRKHCQEASREQARILAHCHVMEALQLRRTG